MSLLLPALLALRAPMPSDTICLGVGMLGDIEVLGTPNSIVTGCGRTSCESGCKSRAPARATLIPCVS